VVVAVEVLVPEDHQQRVLINLVFQEDQVEVNQVIKILPLQELVLEQQVKVIEVDMDIVLLLVVVVEVAVREL
tara:strand:- start:98 stop:316 length:219 start_codon:yes stop_codon:yes gene_type:complete